MAEGHLLNSLLKVCSRGGWCKGRSLHAGRPRRWHRQQQRRPLEYRSRRVTSPPTTHLAGLQVSGIVGSCNDLDIVVSQALHKRAAGGAGDCRSGGAARGRRGAGGCYLAAAASGAACERCRPLQLIRQAAWLRETPQPHLSSSATARSAAPDRREAPGALHRAIATCTASGKREAMESAPP